MNSYVLDASVVLALLNAETGWQKVAQILQGHEVCIGAVNHAEVIAKLFALGMPEHEIAAVWASLSIPVVPFEMEASYLSGSLFPFTKPLGLSLGDRACLALGIRRAARVLTADKAWLNLAITGLHVELIR